MSSHDPGLHQNLQISVSLGKLFLLLRREGTIAMVRAMVMQSREMDDSECESAVMRVLHMHV